ncbi:tyrosine-type recombinase/integrase [Bacillus sp. Marseille-P3661]|uniref:tyrosine-type recombinase/integrase n=1 Tax=Bacillus sp. Marseille-P3661 TaxID=1936234 RepID=UPI000C82DF60|nr:tyrosine-type recombinase/integrase [Bacillus sp. Marseille-P3661]
MNLSADQINSFEKWLHKHEKSINTIKTYKSVLKKFNVWLEENGRNLMDVQQQDIQQYMDTLELQGKSATTIDKIYASIRVFAYFLNKPELVEAIKVKEKEKNIYQTVPEFLNEEERASLLNEVEEDKDLRNIAIVHMLLYTGIRISELCNLNVEDLNISGQKGTVTIKAIKDDRERIIPIPQVALLHIRRYVETVKDQQGPLFMSKQNSRITIRSVQYMLEKYNINPHKLRHTFCRDLIEKGLDISVVAQLAGHKDLNITKRYKNAGA